MNRTGLSKIVWRFLKSFCPEHLFEEISGDLEQRYERDLIILGESRAQRRLFWNTIRFFRPGIILRNGFTRNRYQNYMWRNYLRIMMRNLIKQKLYSAINIIGLTVGITFALLIGTFVWTELQVNKDLKDVDRLYLVENTYKSTREGAPFHSPALLSAEALEQYPSVFENYYRFLDRNITVSKGDRHFRVQSMIGDSTLLSIFGFPMLFGDARTALSKPNTAVISEKTAHQYFDRADVVGETLTIKTERQGSQEFVITAVIADLQEKNAVSDFMRSNAQIFLPIQNMNYFMSVDLTKWTSDVITYVKLRQGTGKHQAETLLNKMIESNLPTPASGNIRTVNLSGLSDYYLLANHSAVKALLVSLGIIVCFIILLAVANFVNITLASSFSRLKEVGVRKVIGGIRQQVFAQFLLESVALALISGVASLLLYELMRGYFSNLFNSSLPSLTHFDLYVWTWIVALIVCVGVVAGIYPSIYLSGSKTIDSLKGKFGSVKGTISFSRALIGGQFAIAIFIFVASSIMSEQISYFLNKDLGYDHEYVINVVSAPRLWSPEGFDRIEASKNEFLQIPEVRALAVSWGAPSGGVANMSVRIFRPGEDANTGLVVDTGGVDEDYADVYGIKVKEGEFFYEKNAPWRPGTLVINESAQKALGAKVGDKFQIQFFGGIDYTIAGIVKDFNYESLHETINPMALMHYRDYGAYRHFSFKVKPGSLSTSVEAIEKGWRRIFPEDPIVFDFMDEKIERAYHTELQLKKAASVASVLILIIVLTGVLGLVSLNVNKRTKEIGIRKVLGASAVNILSLISREYVIMMAIAFAIGVPVSYWFIQGWLSGFAYHIDLNFWMFILPVIFVFVVTLTTVGVQAVKRALSNPVNSLRSE